MPFARISAVSAVLTSWADTVRCDECGAALQLHVHRCTYCRQPATKPLGSHSTLRARLAAKIDRQEAARTPWTEVAKAFYASETYTNLRRVAE